MDGGTIWNINIDAAVKGCIAKGFAENEIIVDMLSCYTRNVKTETQISDNALENWIESWDISRFYGGARATMQELVAYPEVNFRYYVMNDNPALGFAELNFTTEITWPLQQNGMAQAAAAIAAGEGMGF